MRFVRQFSDKGSRNLSTDTKLLHAQNAAALVKILKKVATTMPEDGASVIMPSSEIVYSQIKAYLFAAARLWSIGEAQSQERALTGSNFGFLK